MKDKTPKCPDCGSKGDEGVFAETAEWHCVDCQKEIPMEDKTPLASQRVWEQIEEDYENYQEDIHKVIDIAITEGRKEALSEVEKELKYVPHSLVDNFLSKTWLILNDKKLDNDKRLDKIGFFFKTLQEELIQKLKQRGEGSHNSGYAKEKK